MRTPSGSRQIACRLFESVREHPHRFAIATILAVGLLALAWPAEAEVVYTPVNVVLSGSGSIRVDLNHDGRTDFTVQAATGYRSCSPIPGEADWALVNVTPGKGNGVVAIGKDAAELGINAEIDSSQSFYQTRALMAEAEFASGPPACGPSKYFWGYWCRGSAFSSSCSGEGYLGLEFGIDGSTHYGWAQMSIVATKHFPTPTLEVRLKGYAYETIPGKSITAGQTSGAADDATGSPDEANPQDSDPSASVTSPTHAESLGMLALASQEVPLCRRKESAPAASENN